MQTKPHDRREALKLKRHLHTLAIAAMLLPGACNADTTTAPGTAPTTSTAPAAKSAHPNDPPPMHFDTTAMTIKGKDFTIEVAVSEAQEQRGLMYRDSMPDDHGMLFLFEKPVLVGFWMQNTRIPLDIIFLDKDGRVLTTFHAKPMDETSLAPDSPALYVIELNVGMADKLGLKKGDMVSIPKKYLKN